MKRIIFIIALVLSLFPLGAVYHKIGDFDTSGVANAVLTTGNIAYIADGSIGLLIVDITNPQNPTLLGTFNTAYEIYNIAIEGNIAYLQSYYGIQIISIAEPQNPSQLGFYYDYNTNLFTVNNGIAYTIESDHYLKIVDVSNPQNPILLGSCQTLHTYCLAMSDSLIYVGGQSGMSMIDISIPQNPSQIGYYHLNGYVNYIELSGNIVYLAYQSYVEYINDNTVMVGGLKCIDASNPQNPVQIGSYDAPMECAKSVLIANNIAYLTIASYFTYCNSPWAIDGLKSIDVTNPQTPVLVDYYALPAGKFFNSYNAFYCHQLVAICGDIAYVADYGSGLQIINLSSHSNPAIIYAYTSQPYAFKVEVIGDAAYLIDGHTDTGLQSVFYDQNFSVLDLSNLQSPYLICTYDSLSRVKGFSVQNNLVYLAIGPPPYTGPRWYDGLQVIDFSNLQSPILLYSSEYYGSNAVVVEDSLAYVAFCSSDGNWSDIGILDVSNPQIPVHLGYYPTTGTARSIAVSNGIVYVTHSSYPLNRLEIIDFLDPLNPSLLGSLGTLGDAYKVIVEGNVVYLADGSSGLQIINVSNPASPFLVSSILPHATSNINLCYIHDYLLYIADDNWNEISIYDITTPLSPVFISRYAWNLNTVDMCVSAGRIFTANEEGGLNILNLVAVENDNEVQIPHSGFKMRNFPNPFNLETTISYNIATKGLVCLEIYNSKGQLIKSLLNESQAKGEHTLTWNGKDDAGRSVASGLYLCRIISAGQHESRKMLLLK